jgi:hypothetical protein
MAARPSGELLLELAAVHDFSQSQILRTESISTRLFEEDLE